MQKEPTCSDKRANECTLTRLHWVFSIIGSLETCAHDPTFFSCNNNMSERLKRVTVAPAGRMVKRSRAPYGTSGCDVKKLKPQCAPVSEEGFKEGLPLLGEGTEAREVKEKRRRAGKEDIYKRLLIKIEDDKEKAEKEKGRLDGEMIMQALSMNGRWQDAIQKAEELGQGWDAAEYCGSQCATAGRSDAGISEDGEQDLLALLEEDKEEMEQLQIEIEAVDKQKRRERKERDISEYLQAFKSGKFNAVEAIPKEETCQWWWDTEEYCLAEEQHLYGRFQDMPSWVDFSCYESQIYAKGMEHVAQQAFRFILDKTQGKKRYKVRRCA